MAFGVVFRLFICALLWWRRRCVLQRRRHFVKRMAFRRRMKQLMLKQDAERSLFLAAMMTAATKVTLTRRTIWMKRRNQAFLVAPNNCLWMVSNRQQSSYFFISPVASALGLVLLNSGLTLLLIRVRPDYLT